MSAPRTDDHRWPCRTQARRTVLEGGHEALLSKYCMATRMAATRWWTRPAARPCGHRVVRRTDGRAGERAGVVRRPHGRAEM